jgi:Na+/H+ antiporter NhaC
MDLMLGLGLSSMLLVGTAAYGCTQTIAILLTQQLTQEAYEKAGLDRPDDMGVALVKRSIVARV